MPRLKSAIKRVRTSKRNKLRNVGYKTQIKTVMKKITDLVSANNLESATKERNTAFSLIDRACSKKILHYKNAANKKARITKWIKTLEKKPA